ncbi:tyrosine--tRNA ligase [Candidatus Methylacidithermus pantelleriae]|uniref:Tyrosine--tRNA ligase n=1 Tax=Candidatus Methylacidithermus pantelleriae TaxID=2744239 RepID=A0A8J2BLC8_9BACT|nr:tyrosine--tRNA ligase [Candidatus Methylacidithermus pantelleriae]CAF0702523.1 Tyrosine--tRNA ligase [Candidatus Methylacidithermus pantelleriae]
MVSNRQQGDPAGENLDFSLARLIQGSEAVITLEELQAKLRKGRPLRVKFGVDPTSADIHLGHAVPLFKLRQWQEAGHVVVLIVGDFTARIGDPTGRNSTRPELALEEIQANARTYQEQAFRILRPDRTEVLWNGTWFEKMSAGEFLALQKRVTATRLLQRREFQERRDRGEPIGLHELVYPLLQAWDSVVVQADVELGGSDQLFNLLLGRELQAQVGQEPQVVQTVSLLEGLDGTRKMSKSFGNTIGITESPQEIFGKVMSISDELMLRWYQVLLGTQPEPGVHPMEAKKRLAQWIIERVHDPEAAQKARESFERVFSRREFPEDAPEMVVESPQIPLVRLLHTVGAASSLSEARRLVAQGAVSLDGEKCSDPNKVVDCSKGIWLRCGKRFFAKIRTLPRG